MFPSIKYHMPSAKHLIIFLDPPSAPFMPNVSSTIACACTSKGHSTHFKSTSSRSPPSPIPSSISLSSLNRLAKFAQSSCITSHAPQTNNSFDTAKPNPSHQNQMAAWALAAYNYLRRLVHSEEIGQC